MAALASGACVAHPRAHEFPSPDGAYLVRTEVAPWPAILGGARVTLTLRHVQGEPVELARFAGVKRLEMAWLGVGRLKICAEARTRETADRVKVISPRGQRVFEVSYGCPAVGVRDGADADRPPTAEREGERRLAETVIEDAN